MNIRQLKIFQAVCEDESITKAAKRLYISQPAVSSTIIELEEHLGFNLFDRVSRGIVLNDKGRVFLERVNRLLITYEDFENSFKEINEKSPIKVGSSITIASQLLPKAIVEFNKDYPGTPVEVTVRNAEDIEKMVKDNQLDIGLVEGVVKSEDVEKITISHYNLVIVGHPNHPFSNLKEVSLMELVNTDFLLREKGSALRDVFESHLLLNNLSVHPLWTSINSQALINAVMYNLGLSVLPKQLVQEYLDRKDLVEIKVKGLSMNNQNHIIYNNKRPQSNSVKHLMSLIQDFSKEENND